MRSVSIRLNEKNVRRTVLTILKQVVNTQQFLTHLILPPPNNNDYKSVLFFRLHFFSTVIVCNKCFFFKAGLPTGYVDKISQNTQEKASAKKVN